MESLGRRWRFLQGAIVDFAGEAINQMSYSTILCDSIFDILSSEVLTQGILILRRPEKYISRLRSDSLPRKTPRTLRPISFLTLSFILRSHSSLLSLSNIKKFSGLLTIQRNNINLSVFLAQQEINFLSRPLSHKTFLYGSSLKRLI